MLKIEVSAPSSQPSHTPSLADLSRNASVISSSSSSSSTSDLTIQTPARPRPLRTFSSPQKPLRSTSPQSPTTPRGSRPPAYLTKELGVAEDDEDRPTELRPPASRNVSRSRNSSVNGRGGVNANDFEFGRTLGEGSYSTVMLAKNINTGQEYAIKILDKGHLNRKKKLSTAIAEKNTLVRLGSGHPGIVRLHSAFQDDWSLYFVLDLARNGELQSRISRMGSLSLPCARYYAAQIVDALAYMHGKGVIHRDLKPENLLLDDNFRLKITDFGTGKILDSGAERAKTFVGTAQYVAPELLENSETSKSSDYWALGCIIYQMICGRFAFQGLSEYLTWEKIKQLKYSFPDDFDEDAKDLVQKLLVRDPSQRLGAGEPGSANDVAALRSHPFFSSIHWATLWTDPAPPLEAGMLKKDPPPANGNGSNNWEDVGAAWDELVDGDHEGDELSWASDVEDGGYRLAVQQEPFPATRNGLAQALGAAEVGPFGEVRPYSNGSLPTTLGSSSPEDAPSSPVLSSIPPKSNGPTPAAQTDAQPPTGVRFVDDKSGNETDAEEVRDTVPPTLDDIPSAVRTQPIDVPAKPTRDSYSTGSATSSSDGSTVEKLEELSRGRKRAQTPIQRNGSSDDEQWHELLHPGESVLFNATVETSALRRRASRLFAIAVSPRRKTRELVLTDRRLMCLKSKPGRSHTVRYEWTLHAPPSGKDKDKEYRCAIIGVEAKGEKEFVVMTPSKSYSFLTTSSPLASMWIRKIREALDTQKAQPTH